MDKRFAIPGVDGTTPLGLAAAELLLSKAEPLFELEAAAAGGADADAVHDMRVASRRLREALRLFGPLYPPREARRWYKRIRRITRALGPVRDADVRIDAFAKLGRQAGLTEEGRRAVAYIVGFTSGARIHELEALNRELASLDLERNRAAFASFARSLVGTRDAARPFAEYAHAEVAARAAVVFGAQPAALDEAAILQQHALRIDYKRLRYAVEAFAACYGETFSELHSTLTAFQDALGEMHDTHVFLELVHDPQLATAARAAGVTDAGTAEVAAVLDAQAHECFERFAELAAEHPPESLLPRLLLPLVLEPVGRSGADADAIELAADTVDPDAARGSSSDPEGLLPDAEAPIVAPVAVGDEPWEDGWGDARPPATPGPTSAPEEVP